MGGDMLTSGSAGRWIVQADRKVEEYFVNSPKLFGKSLCKSP
jgi:hypothetical protein